MSWPGRLISVLMVVIITVTLMWVLGHIPFAPWATTLLVDLTDSLGIHGTEDIEDAYIVLSGVVAFSIAFVTVRTVNRRRHFKGRKIKVSG